MMRAALRIAALAAFTLLAGAAMAAPDKIGTVDTAFHIAR